MSKPSLNGRSLGDIATGVKHTVRRIPVRGLLDRQDTYQVPKEFLYLERS
jgi:hypothetical protein